jgi:adenine-specific DNA-methyltransferase
MITTSSILEEVDLLRLTASRELNPATRAEQGQFLTPLQVARIMASFFGELPQTVHLLDAGAGVGSLTAAFMDEALSRDRPPQSISVTACETEVARPDRALGSADALQEDRHKVSAVAKVGRDVRPGGVALETLRRAR